VNKGFWVLPRGVGMSVVGAGAGACRRHRQAPAGIVEQAQSLVAAARLLPVEEAAQVVEQAAGPTCPTRAAAGAGPDTTPHHPRPPPPPGHHHPAGMTTACVQVDAVRVDGLVLPEHLVALVYAATKVRRSDARQGSMGTRRPVPGAGNRVAGTPGQVAARGPWPGPLPRSRAEPPRRADDVGYCGWPMLTIHGMPNRSTHMPNSSPHICFSSGTETVPPSESLCQ
jgi:hypothetical protein